MKHLEFFTSGSNAFRSKDKPQVGHFGVAKNAFGEIDFELMLVQLGQNFLQNLKIVLVCGGVDNDVDVHDDVVNTIKNFFHKALEQGWAAK